MTLHGSDAGSAQKSSAKHLGAKKTPATFCIVSQQKRNQRRTSGLQGATQVSFASRILHISRGLCAIMRCRDEASLQKPLAVPGPPAGWLAWLPPLCGLLTDKLSPSGRCPGTVQRFFRGQTGDWRVSRYGCSNLLATYQLGERRGCACNNACELS